MKIKNPIEFLLDYNIIISGDYTGFINDRNIRYLEQRSTLQVGDNNFAMVTDYNGEPLFDCNLHPIIC